MESKEYNALQKLIDTRRQGIGTHYTEKINDKVVLDIHFQDGGTATHEKNGIFIEDLLIAAYTKLDEFNHAIPSRENSVALTNIEQAIMWLHSRKVDRETRGVYGTELK